MIDLSKIQFHVENDGIKQRLVGQITLGASVSFDRAISGSQDAAQEEIKRIIFHALYKEVRFKFSDVECAAMQHRGTYEDYENVRKVVLEMLDLLKMP